MEMKRSIDATHSINRHRAPPQYSNTQHVLGKSHDVTQYAIKLVLPPISTFTNYKVLNRYLINNMSVISMQINAVPTVNETLQIAVTFRIHRKSFVTNPLYP